MHHSYRAVIEPLIDTVRAIVERGEALQSVAFIGNLQVETLRMVLIETDSEDAKNRSVAAIRSVAASERADFVFLVIDAWGLDAKQMNRYQEIIAEYGSIGASPYRIDMVSFTLETPDGVWAAQAPITADKTFGKPKFVFSRETGGRFCDLLPARSEQQPSTRLH